MISSGRLRNFGILNTSHLRNVIEKSTHQHFKLLGIIWTFHSPRETQAVMQRLCICLFGTPTSGLQLNRTNNFHSDDSVAYGKTFSWINSQVHVKHWTSLRFWIDQTFAQLTLYYNVLKTTESETKIWITKNEIGVFPTFHETTADLAGWPHNIGFYTWSKV